MHPAPATVASVLLLLAALALVALTALTVRPEPRVAATQAAPGPPPREHGREPRARRTPRRGPEARTARPAARSTPAATAVTPDVAATAASARPTAVVAAYYHALDAGRFQDAWKVLAPAVRASFGDFKRWRDGYATTLSSTPRAMEVAQAGGVTTVAHELVAEDRSPCGPVRRVFAVRWKLVPAAGGWRATALSAAKRAGREPAEACAARHDAAGVAGPG